MYLPFPTRLDKRFIKLHGKRKAFHRGGNSSCRLHLCQHFDLYKEKCEIAHVPVNHWAIPRNTWRIMEAEKEEARQGRCTKKKEKQLLAFQTVAGPREFTRAGALHAVAKLIATNNQVCFSICCWHHETVSHTCSPSHLPITSCFATPLLRCGQRPQHMISPVPTMSRFTSTMSSSSI